jgi:hypothetical protein
MREGFYRDRKASCSLAFISILIWVRVGGSVPRKRISLLAAPQRFQPAKHTYFCRMSTECGSVKSQLDDHVVEQESQPMSPEEKKLVDAALDQLDKEQRVMCPNCTFSCFTTQIPGNNPSMCNIQRSELNFSLGKFYARTT